MAITIALVRGWPLAMSDKVAVNLARQLGVRCLSLEQFLDGPNEGIQPPLFD